MTPATFGDALAAQLRSDAARPFVTFYDDASGERVELSVATYANWVAKTAGLVQDEFDVERGGLVLVDLPTHWLGAVWAGAAWTSGLRLTDDVSLTEAADLVVTGPDGVSSFAASAPTLPVLGISLRPLGVPFAEALPPGVVDYGAVVLGQPDSFVPADPPGPGDVAWTSRDQELTQSDVLGLSLPDAGPAVRLLTDLNPTTVDGLATLVGPLLAGGGTIWVRHPDEAGWDRRRAAERATAVLRAG